jgi:molybdenum cofactor synthesis domain-containing protein
LPSSGLAVEPSIQHGRKARTAAIVVIGDEILSAKIVDTNTPFLLAELRELGVQVRRILVVPDVVEEIVEAIQATEARYDYIFTSGGVGPTHDDVTMQAIAKAKGCALVRHPELVKLMEELSAGRPLQEAHLRMAEVPERANLVYASSLRFPLVVLDNIYILPGIPEIFREKFLAVKERFRSEPFHVRRFFCKAGEPHLTPLMAEIVRQFPEVSVGSYPTLSARDYRVEVTLESKDRDLLERAAQRFRELVGEETIFKVEQEPPCAL